MRNFKIGDKVDAYVEDMHGCWWIRAEVIDEPRIRRDELDQAIVQSQVRDLNSGRVWQAIRSYRTSRCATHDSGPAWFAIPFLLRTFTLALCRSPGAPPFTLC